MDERTCSVEGCVRSHEARGWCSAHYQRWYKYGDPHVGGSLKPARGPCSVDGCERKLYGRGLCSMHWQRWRKHGEPGPAAPFLNALPSECVLDGCVQVPRKRGLCNAHYLRWYRATRIYSEICAIEGCGKPRKGREWCIAHYQRWRTHGDPNILLQAANGQADYLTVEGYRRIHVSGKGIVFEHRYVMEQQLGRALLPGETVHHRNGNRVDNRHENLELWARNQPPGQRASDLLAWAEEIVARYGPERDKL